MRTLRVSENSVSGSELKAQAADWLRRIGETGASVVVTQNGKPAAVLLSPRAFFGLTEQARVVAAVGEGLANAQADRVHSHAEVVRGLKTRAGEKAK